MDVEYLQLHWTMLLVIWKQYDHMVIHLTPIAINLNILTQSESSDLDSPQELAEILGSRMKEKIDHVIWHKETGRHR